MMILIRRLRDRGLPLTTNEISPSDCFLHSLSPKMNKDALILLICGYVMRVLRESARKLFYN